MGTLKCNWDATIDFGGSMIGVGIIICNSEGVLVASKCLTKPYITYPQVAKAVVAWLVVQLIRQLGILDVILEEFLCGGSSSSMWWE